jgi:predicted ATPase
MLKKIAITAFKSVAKQELKCAPLTILAGANASGKSSVIQAILLAQSAVTQRYLPYLNQVVSVYSLYEDVVCRWADESVVGIALEGEKGVLAVELVRDGLVTVGDPSFSYHYEENLFYLSSERVGPEEVSHLDKSLRVGELGQFLLGSFALNKDQPVVEELRVSVAPAITLKSQVEWWLSYVTGYAVSAVTEKITANSVRNRFVVEELGEVSPLNTGVGNSYLLKVLLVSLMAKPGDLLLIESPEIHLHPAAQSRLGEFLGFVAHAGIQIIAETHCEHLINRLRYEVFKKKIMPEDVVIHYKSAIKEPFLSIGINTRGHFVDDNENEVPFPSGFFDETLSELLEVG